MPERLSGLIEMSLVFGSVLALAIAELVLLRRAQRRDKSPDAGARSGKLR